MTQREYSQMRLSLSAALLAWWEEDLGNINLPIVGENTFEIMATAALTVIEGIDDIHEYLQENQEE